MTYFTNHCWCSESNWNGENFFGEVHVVINKYIDTDSISQFDDEIEDPDYINLTTAVNVFNKEIYDMKLEFKKERAANRNEPFDEAAFFEEQKEVCVKEIRCLTPEVIAWLNENVKDQPIYKKEDDDEVSRSPLADTKGWAIGNDAYNARQAFGEVSIFFARQVDALKFIRKFSVFKMPTFYFDYFLDKARIEMPVKDIFEIINLTSDVKLDWESFKSKDEDDRDYDTSTNMDYNNFRLMDWEKNVDEYGYSDDIYLTDEEKQLAIKEILSVENS